MPIELFTELEIPQHAKRKLHLSLKQVFWIRNNCQLLCARCVQPGPANVNQWGLLVCTPCELAGDKTGMSICDSEIVLIKSDGMRLTQIPDDEDIKELESPIS